MLRPTTNPECVGARKETCWSKERDGRKHEMWLLAARDSLRYRRMGNGLEDPHNVPCYGHLPVSAAASYVKKRMKKTRACFVKRTIHNNNNKFIVFIPKCILRKETRAENRYDL